MAMDKAYIDFHKERIVNIAFGFSSKDIYNLDYDSLRFNHETKQYDCYGYIIKCYGKEYYILDEKDKDNDQVSSCYKALYHSIEEVNGFISALYKVYHKSIVPR